VFSVAFVVLESSVNNQLRKAPFYGGDGGNKGSFQRWQWQQQRLLPTVAMASFNSSKWLKVRLLYMAVLW
jgi:hypothetical protein